MGNYFKYESPVNFNKPGTYRTQVEIIGYLKVFVRNIDDVNDPIAIATLRISPGELVTVPEQINDYGHPNGKVGGKCWTDSYEVLKIKGLSGDQEYSNCYVPLNKFFEYKKGEMIRRPVKHDHTYHPSEACYFYTTEYMAIGETY